MNQTRFHSYNPNATPTVFSVMLSNFFLRMVGWGMTRRFSLNDEIAAFLRRFSNWCNSGRCLKLPEFAVPQFQCHYYLLWMKGHKLNGLSSSATEPIFRPFSILKPTQKCFGDGLASKFWILHRISKCCWGIWSVWMQFIAKAGEANYLFAVKNSFQIK